MPQSGARGSPLTERRKVVTFARSTATATEVPAGTARRWLLMNNVMVSDMHLTVLQPFQVAAAFSFIAFHFRATWKGYAT